VNLSLEELRAVVDRFKAPTQTIRVAPDVREWIDRTLPKSADPAPSYYGLRVVVDPELEPGEWVIE
jgi:flagellar biosynthesis/type III secretory pathway protein FliH